MKVAEALASTRRSLAGATPDASIEAEVLVRYASRLDRAALYASLSEPVDSTVWQEVASLVHRRLDGEPLAYITGRREFYGLELQVTPDVLVPRQETETLVEKVVEFVRSRGRGERVTVVDVGTGSGAIAAALATQLQNVAVIGTDLSPRALKVADANLRRLGLRHRVHLVLCDLLDCLAGPFDVIVSNPPYVATADMDGLPADVQREPAMSLDGGFDGLRVVERLVRHSAARLAPVGGLFVEIAPNQARRVAEMARWRMPGCSVAVADDLTGAPRVVVVHPGT